MHAEQLNAFIVTGNDPHMGEYVAPRWKTREWISGFSGSAGTVVITQHSAGLWTDSRYFIQAEQQLKGTPVELFRMGQAGVPDIYSWLSGQLKSGETVGCDEEVTSVESFLEMKRRLAACEIQCRGVPGMIDSIWTDRPAVPHEEIFSVPMNLTGRSREEKIQEIRNIMVEEQADWFLISALDEIAWLLNLRGADIPYNPLFYSYVIAGRSTLYLFVNEEAVPKSLQESLASCCTVKPYESAAEVLNSLGSDDNPKNSGVVDTETHGEKEKKLHTLLFDPGSVSLALQRAVPESFIVKKKPSCIAGMKACKTVVELEHMREAHRQDGTALTEFLYMIEKLENQNRLSDETELSLAEKLISCRSRQPDFLGESFVPIFAFQDHGPICHYSAEEASAYPIRGKGLLVMDTGGQYWGGTTDVTRTLLFGEAADEERRDYTLVLKGHIALAEAVFPEGTRGIQLDTLARKPLWDEGKNYGHGTGHGVGFMLNVHEGPQSISTKMIDIPLKQGMVISNEPGLYIDGKYGIRIENLIIVESAHEKSSEMFGQFYHFSTITLVPLEKRLIDPTLLTENEIRWIDTYHAEVFRQIGPRLGEEERAWLEKKTEPLAAESGK